MIPLDAIFIFDLVTTHGLPLDIIEDRLAETGISYDKAALARLMEMHRTRSRAGRKFTARIFKETSP